MCERRRHRSAAGNRLQDLPAFSGADAQHIACARHYAAVMPSLASETVSMTSSGPAGCTIAWIALSPATVCPSRSACRCALCRRMASSAEAPSPQISRPWLRGLRETPSRSSGWSSTMAGNSQRRVLHFSTLSVIEARAGAELQGIAHNAFHSLRPASPVRRGSPADRTRSVVGQCHGERPSLKAISTVCPPAAGMPIGCSGFAGSGNADPPGADNATPAILLGRVT